MKNLCAVNSEDCSVHSNSRQLQAKHLKARVDGAEVNAVEIRLLLSVKTPHSRAAKDTFLVGWNQKLN